MNFSPSIFECFTDSNAVYDLENNTLGITLELVEAATANPYETIEVKVFDFDYVGFNMNGYESEDNSPLAIDNVVALPAPTLKSKVISPLRAYVLSQLCESELTIWEKQLLEDYGQAA